MKKGYQIARQKESGKLREFLVEQGQVMLPMVELISEGRLAVEQLVSQLGRAALEAVLLLSAEQVAGPRHPGKAAGEVRRHGQQPGVVALATQKVRLQKPRLRRRSGGPGAEIAVPAYRAMQADSELRERLLGILVRGVSTRHYQEVVPEMAERCGVSRSAVSREFAQASGEALRRLGERRFDGVDLLVIYVDGQCFGEHQVVAAVGVDTQGNKHVLGISEGATENAVVVTRLLEDLVERGVKTDRRRLFVIDGSKALRKAIDAVYGAENPVQRCRHHKEQNVLGYLPKELQGQVKAALRAAWRLGPEEGMKRLLQQAQWLERAYPQAAASLHEGLEETFTISRMSLPASLHRCLATTNLIESPSSGVRLRTRRVTRWRNGEMVLRWAATAWLETEKHFRKIMGHRDLWMLQAALADSGATADRAGSGIDKERVAA